jgi:lipopolysaccharide transport system ATP-binding protein
MVGEVVIRAEGLGKKYTIGHEAERMRYSTLRDTLARTVKGFARSSMDILRGRQLVVGNAEDFWALRDLNFEIKRGEVVGIIGRNGAGKSTLLKILSRITEPTEGRVTIRGRVASLLEVGTGFHPELTGQENIYLNGAILGMTRAEIRRKFDEIVAFAEVDRFLDTPVKRYSSGMYVRLAFAVAAHLEPEILVVDEVLAVGDIEFQKKCIGKMSEVAGHGRTVLFVSHNMTAVQTLCEKVILLHDGQLSAKGSSAEVIGLYLASNVGESVADGDLRALRRQGIGSVRFRRIEFFDKDNLPVVTPGTGDELVIVLEFDASHTETRPARLSLSFHDTQDTPLFICDTEASGGEAFKIGAGDKAVCRIPRLPLSAGRYKINLFLEINGTIEDWLKDYVLVDVPGKSFFGTARNLPRGWEGKTVLVDNEWHRISGAGDREILSAQPNEFV